MNDTLESEYLKPSASGLSVIIVNSLSGGKVLGYLPVIKCSFREPFSKYPNTSCPVVPSAEDGIPVTSLYSQLVSTGPLTQLW